MAFIRANVQTDMGGVKVLKRYLQFSIYAQPSDK